MVCLARRAGCCLFGDEPLVQVFRYVDHLFDLPTRNRLLRCLQIYFVEAFEVQKLFVFEVAGGSRFGGGFEESVADVSVDGEVLEVSFAAACRRLGEEGVELFVVSDVLGEACSLQVGDEAAEESGDFEDAVRDGLFDAAVDQRVGFEEVCLFFLRALERVLHLELLLLEVADVGLVRLSAFLQRRAGEGSLPFEVDQVRELFAHVCQVQVLLLEETDQRRDVFDGLRGELAEEVLLVGFGGGSEFIEELDEGEVVEVCG